MKERMVMAMVAVVLLGSIVMPDSVLGQIVAGVRVVTLPAYRKRFDIPTQDAIQRYLFIDVTKMGIGTEMASKTSSLSILWLSCCCCPGEKGDWTAIRRNARRDHRPFLSAPGTI